MNKWREKALELLPDMRADIEKAESVAMLWVELEVRYRRYYDRLSEGVGQGGAQLIRPIYVYAIWCSRAESAETSDAATIGFYYGIPVNAFNTFRSDPSKYEHILEDLVSNLGLPEIERMRWAFAALIEPPNSTSSWRIVVGSLAIVSGICRRGPKVAKRYALRHGVTVQIPWDNC